MGKYIVTIDIPVRIRVLAADEEEAERMGDARFARYYEMCEAVLDGDPDVWFGNRYDDTEVEEETA